MGKLRDIWNFAESVVWEIGDRFDDFRHRKQKFQVADERGVTTYYAPKEIDVERWQKMVRDKIGGETQHPHDISIQHQACLLYFTELVEIENLGVEDAFSKVQTEDIDVHKYVPEFLIPLHGIYADKQESTPLPKP